MKTDPKNSDYSVEAGATRNYEPWRDKDEQARGYALAPPRAAQRARRARVAALPQPERLCRALTRRCAAG